jgi:hypothetical protein
MNPCQDFSISLLEVRGIGRSRLIEQSLLLESFCYSVKFAFSKIPSATDERYKVDPLPPKKTSPQFPQSPPLPTHPVYSLFPLPSSNPIAVPYLFLRSPRSAKYMYRTVLAKSSYNYHTMSL